MARVVEPGGNTHGFGALHPGDGPGLLGEVAGVLDFGFDGALLVALGGREWMEAERVRGRSRQVRRAGRRERLRGGGGISARVWPARLAGVPSSLARVSGGEAARVEASRFEGLTQGCGAGLAGFVGGPGGVVDEAEAAAVRGEAAVGVVDAQVQAELGAGGKHAVGFGGGPGDEVVDEDADVGLGAVEVEGRLALNRRGRR